MEGGWECVVEMHIVLERAGNGRIQKRTPQTKPPLPPPSLPLQTPTINQPLTRPSKRHLARQQVEDQHPQRPPVHSLGVAGALDRFWGYVLGGPAEGEGAALVALGKPGVWGLGIGFGD